MLLTSYFALNALAFGWWLLGHYFGYTGVAAIGGVLIIALGGAVVTGSLEVQTGEKIERSYTNVGTEFKATNETHTNQYSEVAVSREFGGTAGQLSIGGLQMLIGGLLIIHRLNEQNDL